MEDPLKDFEVPPKTASEATLRRWRKLGTTVRNHRRRFRFIANLDKRYEAQQQQSEPLLERQELQESTGVTIISQQQCAPSSEIDIQEELQESGVRIPQPQNAPPLEINIQGLQESGSQQQRAPSLGTDVQELHGSEESNLEVASMVERILLVINILTELLSVAFDYLSSTNKHRYALIAMIMSYGAAIVIIMELAYKARMERVVWRWESMLPWFYHQSSPNYRPFGTVPEMTGLVFAILQTISSTVVYALYLQHVNYSFNVSLLPLVLALAILCSRFMKKTNPEVLSDNIELNQVLVQLPRECN